MTRISNAAAERTTRRPGGVFRRALRYRTTQVGGLVFLGLFAVAIIGPYCALYSTTSIEGLPYAPPSWTHPLGLDYLGRDGLTRFLSGGRSVFGLAALATALAFAFGIAFGLIAAYQGRWSDEAIMRSGDVIMAFPSLILILLLVAGVGTHLWVVVLAVAVTHIPRIMRIVRGATLEVSDLLYVQAAEARGEHTSTILRREILPNIWTPIFIDLPIRFTGSILLIASVSFLGFGIQPPGADWGLMINENLGALTVQPWVVIAPIVAIALVTISISLVGDGIARASGRSLERKWIVT